jgi:hypothetical protein
MTKDTIVAFHIGRGGRFSNPGHLSFLGVQKINETSDFLNNCYPPRLADSEEDDQSPDAEWHDGNGNGVELTNAQIESGIGLINLDGHFDTTYTTTVGKLSEQEIEAVKDSLPDWEATKIMELINEEDE